MKIYEVYDNFCDEHTTYGFCLSREEAQQRVEQLTNKYCPNKRGLRTITIWEWEVGDFSDYLP